MPTFRTICCCDFHNCIIRIAIANNFCMLLFFHLPNFRTIFCYIFPNCIIHISILRFFFCFFFVFLSSEPYFVMLSTIVLCHISIANSFYMLFFIFHNPEQDVMVFTSVLYIFRHLKTFMSYCLFSILQNHLLLWFPKLYYKYFYK